MTRVPEKTTWHGHLRPSGFLPFDTERGSRAAARAMRAMVPHARHVRRPNDMGGTVRLENQRMPRVRGLRTVLG